MQSLQIIISLRRAGAGGLSTLVRPPTPSWSARDSLRLLAVQCQYLHSQLSPRGVEVGVPLGNLLVDDPRAEEAAPKGDPVTSGDLHCRPAALRPQGRPAGRDQACELEGLEWGSAALARVGGRAGATHVASARHGPPRPLSGCAPPPPLLNAGHSPWPALPAFT